VFFVPPLRFPNPGTDHRPFGSPMPVVSPASLEEQLAAAERELDVVNAQDGAENVSNAYGYYIDEFLWDNTAELFSVNGSKELAGVGNYISREHVRESMVARYGRGGRRAGSMTLHQKTEPVVTVAADGQSARIREKLLQLNSARDGDGSYIIGIYENNIVRENGVWKISRMDLDYTWNASYSTGWARVAPRRAAAAAQTATPAQAAAPARASTMPPPDGPLRGAPAAPYPDLATMAFHYRNPVSGRDPPELLPP
jgi:SnoaL-like domain